MKGPRGLRPREHQVPADGSSAEQLQTPKAALSEARGLCVLGSRKMGSRHWGTQADWGQATEWAAGVLVGVLEHGGPAGSAQTSGLGPILSHRPPLSAEPIDELRQSHPQWSGQGVLSVSLGRARTSPQHPATGPMEAPILASQGRGEGRCPRGPVPPVLQARSVNGQGSFTRWEKRHGSIGWKLRAPTVEWWSPCPPSPTLSRSYP